MLFIWQNLVWIRVYVVGFVQSPGLVFFVFLYFLYVWSVLFKLFEFFFVLLANLVHFFFGFVFGLFSGQTKFLGWFMIEPKIQATQTSRLSRVELKKKLYRIWFCHFLTKVFCLKVVFGKQALGLFWLVMLQFLFFTKQSLTKYIKYFFYFSNGQKS